MATKNFTQFNTATPLLTSDYIVGYNAAGTAELKATVKQIVDLVQDSDSQTLTYNNAGTLSISNGNNVMLSSFNDASISGRAVIDNQLYYSTDAQVSQLSALSGNYDEGQFIGRTKLTQNNTRLVNIGENWYIFNDQDILFYTVWSDAAISSDGKYQVIVARGGAGPGEPGKILISNDYGKNWNTAGPAASWQGIAISSDGKYITGVVNDGQIYISNDYGNTWTPKESNRYWRRIAMSSDGKYQTAVGSSSNSDTQQIYISNDYGNNWIPKEDNRLWFDVTMSSDGKYQTAVGGGGFVAQQIYISNDYGNNWTAKDSNRGWFSVVMSSDGKYQTAGTYGGRIYISNDYGNNWTAKASISYWYGIAMSSDGKYQTAVDHGKNFGPGEGRYPGQVYISNDYGNTWIGTEPDVNSFNRGPYEAVAMSSDGKYQIAGIGFLGGFLYISVADELIDGNLTVTGLISSGGIEIGGGNLAADGTFRLGSGDPALEVTQDGNVLASSLSAATLSSSNIILVNATVSSGGTLTTSASSLIITVNGQQFKLPLLQP